MKIFIFGSTGMLGRYVYEVLKTNHTLVCINRADFDIEKDSWKKLDMIIDPLVEANDVIINCAGIIPQKTEQSDYKSYVRVNTLFPHKLNEIALKYNSKFIHITTDCVFDGAKGNYNETDIHTTTTLYGVSKSLGEPEEATVIRTSIIGEELIGKKSFIEWVVGNKNKTIDGFTNHYWNGVTCLTLANVIRKIIEDNLFWRGVKHIFSPEVVTKYDLCNYVNEIYDLNIRIIPTENVDAKNMTLCGSILFDIDTIYNQINEQYNIKYGNYINLSMCRFCNNKDIKQIIKFNDFPLSGSFIKDKTQFVFEKIYPLTLLYCDNCNTGIIKEVIKEDILFTNVNNSGYFYFSSSIESLLTHFKKLSEFIIKTYPTKKKILEIGCNDGVFLNNFIGKSYQIIGIDPSHTINKINSSQIITYNNYFNKETSEDILKIYGKQDIIVCCNCLAHIDNINEIYSNIKKNLSNDGILIIEIHYFKNIIDNNNFDFIYHEHMSYYTISTVVQICKTNNLYLDNIEFIDTHGGSLRCFITHSKDDNIYYNEYLNNYITNEKNTIEGNIYKLFDNLNTWKIELLNIIDNLKKSKKKIIGYGASGRTNMIINFIGVNFDIILDDSINKIGSYMPYYHNIIQDSNSIYTSENIHTIFILAWPYSKSIIKNHQSFVENGGTFYKILPTIEKIDKNNFKNYI